MKHLAVPDVNVLHEAKVVCLAALIALIASALLFANLTTLAAIVTAFGFVAVVERLHRLFLQFRRARSFARCACVALIAVCVFAAVFWVVYLGTPLHVRSAGSTHASGAS